MIPQVSRTHLLTPADLKPSRDDLEVIGVFNPGVTRIRRDVVMLVRVAEKPVEQRIGYMGLPRWEPNGGYVIDWVPDADWISVDPRVVRSVSTGLLRLTSVSHLRVFRQADDGVGRWLPGTAYLPATASEEFGIEDPRITKIGQTYWITYVAVSRQGAATALASSDDMVTYKRHGLIFYPENKDVVLFPGTIDGQYVALHRPNPNSKFSPPQIWLARSPDLLHWGGHRCLHRGRTTWEAERVGGGTPPILIDEGWLHLYHGSRRDERKGHVGEYSVGALLLARDDPGRVLARSIEPIMQPTADFERSGFVPGVVFPTGLIEHDDLLNVYYGAADTSTAVARVAKQDILDALHKQ